MAVIWNDLGKIESQTVRWEDLRRHLASPDFEPARAAHLAALQKKTEGEGVTDPALRTQIQQMLNGMHSITRMMLNGELTECHPMHH